MLLHTLPVASAQAPISPPDYTLICDPTNTQIEVDPNTPKPPEGSVECTVQNQESYAIELSIETELELVETQHVNSIEIQGNSEETFEVSLKAEDEMLMMNLLLELETKVTKTGGFDYSDDESLNYRFLVNILQYGGFSIEAHQSNEDVELIDGEELPLPTLETEWISSFLIRGHMQHQFVMKQKDKKSMMGVLCVSYRHLFQMIVMKSWLLRMPMILRRMSM